MSVFQLKRGESGVVSSVNVDGAAGERLRALGIRRGAKITVLSFSLFKGGVLLSVGFRRVAVRKAVAQRIEI